MKMRKCSECGIKYPLTADNFYKNKTSTDGFNYLCKPCKREYSTMRRALCKALWIEYISNTIRCECNRCGFDVFEALDFHHTDPRNGDRMTTANLMQFTTPTGKGGDQVIKEIKKCELVCANCHRLIHAKII